jgi:hypothetical protein
VFLQPHFDPVFHWQEIVLTVNTFLLIAFIIMAEFVYAGAPKKRRRLRYVYPIFIVLSGLLLFAAFQQGGA